MASLKERVERHDREIAAIRKLIQAGMKMLVKSDENLLRLEGDQFALRREQSAFRQELREQQIAIRQELREQQIAIRQELREEQMTFRKEVREEQIAFRKELRELAASQRETGRLLEAFIRSFRSGSNGHPKN